MSLLTSFMKNPRSSPRFDAHPSSCSFAGTSRYWLGLCCGGPHSGTLAEPARTKLGRHHGNRLRVRQVIWICGGNLPLVPGDSCHYLEVATSVLRGEGPIKQ